MVNRRPTRSRRTAASPPLRRKPTPTRQKSIPIRRNRNNLGARKFKRPLTSPGSANYWRERAYTAGYLAATAEDPPLTEEKSNPVENNLHHKVNARWHQWYQSVKRLPWPLYHAAAARFAEGYRKHAGGYFGNRLLVPTTKKVAAIVTVMNEKDTILSVIEQLHRLPLHEIIFIVNGSTDETFEMIRNQSRAIIVHYRHALGHDVGRAIGAKLSESEILLFLDGDFPVFAEHLVPFIDAIERGVDIALNNISPYIGLFSGRDDVTKVKEFINRSMARADLESNSLTAVPHAMRKQAAQLIGYANLAVPPKAQVIAIDKGLQISSPASVDVITPNRLRARNVGQNNAVSELIIGDHIEALKTALDLKGSRLSFADRIRQRPLTRH
ncbi:glycosyltransferase family 2 protein [Paenibacillus spongiae]|uniref:Glycosyltransferase n=1 Tax=Paenibacillus spongiae TaxID=2909671 RepID=A0ABY5S8G7_9BACL|nr:glycosyltransferase [Paenibacillus spongiae]UVI28618.1 glycosyltransferase [Paenibacillus spongiae]